MTKRQRRPRRARRLVALATAALGALTSLTAVGIAAAAPSAAAPPTRAIIDLAAFVAAEAAQVHAQEAQAAHVADAPPTTAPPPFLTATSKPISVGGTLTAIVAFSTLGTADPVQVLTFHPHGWEIAATLPPPRGGGTASGTLFLAPNSSVSEASVSGDTNPAFLLPLLAADNTPGAVVTKVGHHWRYVTFGQPFTKSQVVGRNPRFAEHTVISYDDNCSPNCAAGKTSTVVWHYHAAAVEFVAAGPH